MSLTEAEFQQRRENALLKLETAANIWHQFTTGPATLQIVTASGTIPTLAGLIEDLRDEHQEELGPIFQTIAEAIDSVSVSPLNGPITTP